MSVAGISSSLFHYNPQTRQNNLQNFQKEFQQLGQDLQSGNLTAAQADFATQQDAPASNVRASSQNSSPIAQAFSQLAKDLQSGNISAQPSRIFDDPSAGFSESDRPQAAHHHHGGGVERESVSCGTS